MRDAGIELYELTDAALHWFLRSSDKGHYGIYLEARGVNVVVDKSNSDPELEDGRMAGWLPEVVPQRVPRLGL